MSIPFQPGSQKIVTNYEKQYHPYLYRNGRRHYAGRGLTWFKTATDALLYAHRWAARSARFLEVKENSYVD